MNPLLLGITPESLGEEEAICKRSQAQQGARWEEKEEAGRERRREEGKREREREGLELV